MALTASQSVLPPELWENIFDLATHVSGVFAPGIYTHIERFGAFVLSAKPALRFSLGTRRHLPLVCRTWYILSIRFLYRSLWVGAFCSDSTLIALLAALRGTTHLRSALGVDSLGAYTARIDIMCSKQIREGSPTLETLASIIQLLPKLSVFIFSCPNTYCKPSRIIDALKLSGTSLRVVDFNDSITVVDPADLQTLCEAAPGLRVLGIDKCYRRGIDDWRWNHWDIGDGPIEAEMSHLPIMPLLSTFKYNLFATQIALQRESFPQLRELVVRYNGMLATKWYYLAPLANSLESITLVPVKDNTSSLQAELDQIARSCPHLQRLVFRITVTGTPEITRQLFLPPVRVLGICLQEVWSLSEDLRDIFYTPLWDALVCICERQPSIEKVQFVEDPESSQGRRIADAIASFPQLPLENLWVEAMQ